MTASSQSGRVHPLLAFILGVGVVILLLVMTRGCFHSLSHMGWNGMTLRSPHPLFEGIDPESEFYFVHSYYPAPSESHEVLGETYYGIRFASVLRVQNLVAMQFHPEKSGRPGLKILSNFCKWSGMDDA